jgi:predicted enzyme related to lactoylglutathione lyase
MVFKNAISWFEIPTQDIARAQKFYETIFQIQMIQADTPQIKMRMFPIENPMNIGGAIVYNAEFYKPSSTQGPLVYLCGDPDVANILGRIDAAGGKVLVPKTMISPEYGFMAVFLDSEGNRIGLHQLPE